MNLTGPLGTGDQPTDSSIVVHKRPNPSAYPPDQPFRLEDLPNEVQTMIYRLLLPGKLTVYVGRQRKTPLLHTQQLIYRSLQGTPSHAKVLRSGIHPADHHPVEILHVNRRIYELALGPLYALHTFVFANSCVFFQFCAECPIPLSMIHHMRLRVFSRSDMAAHARSLRNAKRLQRFELVVKRPVEEGLVRSLLKAVGIFINFETKPGNKQINLNKIQFVDKNGVPDLEYKKALVKLLVEKNILPNAVAR